MHKKTSQITNLLTVCVAALLAIGTLNGCSDNHRTYSKTIVFGASLSDTGNTFKATQGAKPGPAPFYFGGRWSNGRLWIEQLASDVETSAVPSLDGGTNYAYGGAKTCTMNAAGTSVAVSLVPDMCNQSQQYLSANPQADSAALYVIDASAVGNNILGALGASPAMSADVVTSSITVDASKDINKIMEDLYTAGARHFLVTNAPDVGSTPYVQTLGAVAASTATALAQNYNQNLHKNVVAFAKNHADARVKEVDFYNTSSNFQAAGITNTTAPCLNATTTTPSICLDPQVRQYWDGFHPTSAVGQLLGTVALRALD